MECLKKLSKRYFIEKGLKFLFRFWLVWFVVVGWLSLFQWFKFLCKKKNHLTWMCILQFSKDVSLENSIRFWFFLSHFFIVQVFFFCYSHWNSETILPFLRCDFASDFLPVLPVLFLFITFYYRHCYRCYCYRLFNFLKHRRNERCKVKCNCPQLFILSNATSSNSLSLSLSFWFIKPFDQ